MDTKGVIGVLVLMAVIAGGWYLLAKAPVSREPAQPAAAEQAAGTNTGSGTIGDLLAMGPSECTVIVNNSGTEEQGTVYVANGKMAGSFAMQMSGKTMNAYLINDGSNLYTWTDQSTQGVKSPAANATTTSTAMTHQGVSNTTPAQYSCAPWTEDDSIFTPPATITFSDIKK